MQRKICEYCGAKNKSTITKKICLQNVESSTSVKMRFMHKTCQTYVYVMFIVICYINQSENVK